MFDKKQKCCVKDIYLVTDDGSYDQKAFYTVKIVFDSSSKKKFIILFIKDFLLFPLFFCVTPCYSLALNEK